MRWFSLLTLGTMVIGFVGCGQVPSPVQRLQNVERQAAAYDWRRLDIDAPPFVLAAWLPRQSSPDTRELTVYIEADGLAWVTKTRPSLDPTPVDPVGLGLAFSHPDVRAAYLARPCQYTMTTDGSVCDQKYWTTHRFAPEVVAATNRAIDVLKKETGAAAIRLVGYSGGGAVAALVAASRDDVSALVSIAGNLDHALWTEHHFVDPLKGSLNPVDVAGKLSRLPQLHFVGTKDKVMPRSIAESFVNRQGEGNCSEVVEVAGAGHREGWLKLWPSLLRRPFPCGDRMNAAPVPVDKP